MTSIEYNENDHHLDFYCVIRLKVHVMGTLVGRCDLVVERASSLISKNARMRFNHHIQIVESIEFF